MHVRNGCRCQQGLARASPCPPTPRGTEPSPLRFSIRQRSGQRHLGLHNTHCSVRTASPGMPAWLLGAGRLLSCDESKPVSIQPMLRSSPDDARAGRRGAHQRRTGGLWRAESAGRDALSTGVVPRATHLSAWAKAAASLRSTFDAGSGAFQSALTNRSLSRGGYATLLGVQSTK